MELNKYRGSTAILINSLKLLVSLPFLRSRDGKISSTLICFHISSAVYPYSDPLHPLHLPPSSKTIRLSSKPRWSNLRLPDCPTLHYIYFIAEPLIPPLPFLTSQFQHLLTASKMVRLTPNVGFKGICKSHDCFLSLSPPPPVRTNM